MRHSKVKRARHGRHRRMVEVRENPSTTTWLVLGAGIAVAGIAAYFIFRPSTAAALPTTPGAPQLPAWTGGGQDIAVRVGQPISVTLPNPPAGATGWARTTESHGGATSNDAPPIATVPGVVVWRFTPVNRGMTVGLSDYNVTITIT